MENKEKSTMTRREYMKAYKKNSAFVENTRVFMRNKLAIAGFIIFLIVVLFALFANVICDYDSVVIAINPAERLMKPCAEHIFGTDELGRDIFGRLIHGARISLRIGLLSVLISLTIGGIIGAVSGFFGGVIDNVIMRAMDVFMCLPAMLLAIAIVAAFGASEFNMMIAIAISTVPQCARIVRSSILSVRGFDYVEAARALGLSTPAIIFKHVLVNGIAPIIVWATMAVAKAITQVAGLSFLGLGIAAPAPEWGTMLSASRGYMRDFPHLVLAPGLAIFFTVLAFNLMGDGLRDALDPKLRH